MVVESLAFLTGRLRCETGEIKVSHSKLLWKVKGGGGGGDYGGGEEVKLFFSSGHSKVAFFELRRNSG